MSCELPESECILHDNRQADLFLHGCLGASMISDRSVQFAKVHCKLPDAKCILHDAAVARNSDCRRYALLNSQAVNAFGRA